MDAHALDTLREWIRAAECFVAFTGAGISTESGIPDFRSPGGVWSRTTPVLFQDFVADPAERARYWRFKQESWPAVAAARPNAGHRALAEWERRGRLRCLITQNVDGLHRLAGSAQVIELHGTDRRVTCLSCGRETPRDEAFAAFERTGEGPTCEACGGLLKVATISFGQPLVEADLAAAVEWAGRADLFLAVGTSLQVYPAASLPEIALRRGGRVAIVNRDPTPFDEHAQLVLRGSAGEVLGAVAD